MPEPDGFTRDQQVQGHEETDDREADLVGRRLIAAATEDQEKLRKPAAIALNACPHGLGVFESSLTTEARHALKTYGLPLAPVAIGERRAFQVALNDGRAVIEFEPKGKAADELRKLWKWLQKEATA